MKNQFNNLGGILMPEIIPDNNEEKPQIPTKPVDVSRWAGRDKFYPKPPKVQPDDSKLRVRPFLKPKQNPAIGTTAPKKEKPKTANTANTKPPSYLKEPPPPVQIKSSSQKLENFFKWIELNGDAVDLKKLSVPSMAAFGLGWYLSDNLTRDEKRRKERELDAEWQRAIERSNKSHVKKSDTKPSDEDTAYQRLQDYYLGREI